MDTLGFDQVPGRATGLVLGDSYMLGRRIGRGAMGEVYEAQHVRLPGHFAVKLLLPELQGNQDAFARFCREAEIMSQLRHPNIVQIFDFNVAPDARPYFVMEYLQGRDLEARLRVGPLSLPAVTRVVGAVSSALALAHAHGVVHRDLKPANIFLATVDGQTDELVKVLDFGISKVRAAAAQISHAVDLLGTPSYMAPEQARGQTDAIDGRTDQFALATIAYRMLTGQDPFQGDDTAAVLYQVVHEDPPPLSMFLPPGWDTAALQTVLDRALAKRPDQRFGGMMELARAFENAAERTLGAGGDAEAPVGLAAAARAARGMAVRLDDAEIDPPPPVRTPAPLVLKPIRRLPTPTPAPLLQPSTPAARPRPATPMAPQMDWEVRNDVDLIPKSHAGIAVLGLLALGAVALLIITGWYKKIPGVGSAVRRQVHEWTRPPGSPPETRIEPTPPAAPVTPAEPSREAASDSAARHDAPPAAPPTVAPPAAATPPATATPEASAAPAAPAPKPRAHRRPAARNLTPRSTARSFAPPPPPAAAPQAAPVQITPPANPPLDGRAFEIAPPKTTDPGRDLAPPSDEAQ
jgi:eukaryotic-like serine/threonine-protein kinase